MGGNEERDEGKASSMRAADDDVLTCKKISYLRSHTKKVEVSLGDIGARAMPRLRHLCAEITVLNLARAVSITRMLGPKENLI